MAEKEKLTMPLLPLRGLIVYPTMVLHLDVGRDKSVQALEKAMMDDHLVCLVSQKDMGIDEPTKEDLYRTGTLAKIKQMLKLPNGTMRVLVEGLNRVTVTEFEDSEEYFVVHVEKQNEEHQVDVEDKALMRTLLDYFEQYIKLSKKVSVETLSTVSDIEEPGRLADIVASHLPIKIQLKQEILEITDVKERLNTIISHIQDEQEVLQLEKKNWTACKEINGTHSERVLSS